MDRDLQDLELMRSGIDYIFPIKIRSWSIDCRPLSNMETIQVATTVSKLFLELSDVEKMRISENTLFAKETLIRAAKKTPDDKDSRVTHAILDRMTNEELHFAFAQYVAITDKVNPALERMPQEEITDLVEKLKKNSRDRLDSALIDCSFLELVNVCRSLIQVESRPAS